MRSTFACFATGLMLLALAPVGRASDGIESRPVHFAKGASSAKLRGTIKGSQTIDYKLSARAGQTMSVSLETSNASNYFNVLPPGSNDVAVFVGSSDGSRWSGTLTANGDHTIRVYLMRNAARRNESANYELTVAVTGSPSASALGAARPNDAKVKGTPYHATGMLPCWMGQAAPDSSQCDFGVIRGANGNAEVHIKPAGGLERVLVFHGEKVTSGDEKVVAKRNADEWVVEVNDYEHYRIWDSVIFGG